MVDRSGIYGRDARALCTRMDRWSVLKIVALGAAFGLIAALMIGQASAEVCIASQYGVGDGHQGSRIACRGFGRFNTWATSPYTVAHKTRPCGSSVRITNLSNGRSISAIVTDRGPYIRGRCVDLGRAGANAIGMGGLARVKVE